MTTPTKSCYLRAIVWLLVIFSASGSTLQAQDCGCTYTIEPTQGYIRATDYPALKPGDVFCIKAGVRGRLVFLGFVGTKEQPIIFKNCGGQVIFENIDYDGTFSVVNSRYFRITGTGSAQYKYGFLVRKASKGSAMYLNNSDFEVDHVEIANAGFAGMMAKVDPNCSNTQFHQGNFIMDNVSIHDNYIHHTNGEGLYIGNTSYFGKSASCGGTTVTLYPHALENLRVYNNITEETGADGIQVSSATKNVEVFNNVIRRYGVSPFEPAQINGLQIGGGSTGKYYNNIIVDGAGNGIQCLGMADIYMFNNLIVRSGSDGIFIDERGTVLAGKAFHAHNNTVVSPKRDGIRMYSRNTTGNTFINNLLVAPGSLSQNYYSRNQYIYIIDSNVKYSQNNNLFVPTVADAGFKDPSNDNYQLTTSSAAVNAGATLSYFNFDLEGKSRPAGGAYDIGAYEYNSTLPPDTGGEYTILTRINSGGDLYADSVKDWERDSYTNKHAYLDPSSSSHTTGSPGAFDARRPNATGVPASVLGNNRYVLCCGSDIKYLIPTVSGKQYKINMYFAKKNGEPVAENQRKFEVRVNGALVETVDLFRAGDGVYTVSKEFVAQQTSASVTLVPLVGQAQINALEVLVKDAVKPVTPVLLHRVNVNGSEIAGSPVWEADGYYTPHAFYDTNHATSGTGSSGAFSSTRKNSTPVPAAALGTYRHTITSRGDIIQYNIPINHPGSEYTVKLYFALKNGEVVAAGQRVFDVVIEGVVVHKDFDVSVAADSAYGLSFKRVINDNTLTFTLVKKVGSAQINAFEIYGPASTQANARTAEASKEAIGLAGEVSTNLFPNPAQEYVYLRPGKKQEAEITLYNGLGAKVNYRAAKSDGEKVKFNVQSLASGLYYIQLRYADGSTETHRFLKK